MNYNLVCTGCGFILAKDVSEETKSIMEPGYCNRCPEQAKLEWRDYTK